mgnify:CR=1 FL=1
MGETPNQRRLAAVLAADVAGYTKLVEQDTDGTVAAWKTARDDVIKPLVAEKSGRIIKFTGDGFLVEFPSVQDAVACAIALQEQLKSCPLKFRMGLNVGDLTDDGGDVHGEGVNIAARLEALAEPGGICISGDVYNQVRNRIKASFRDMGDQDVKHVSRPVRAYAIGAVGEYPDIAASAKPAQRSPVIRYAGIGLVLAVVAGVGWYWQTNRMTAAPSAMTESQRAAVSVIVLPFTNATGDPAQDYIADGLTGSVTSDLSRIRDAFVVATATAFKYKGKSVDLKQLGTDLGVRFVLQGSVQRGGDKIRINAQLADTQTNAQLWAETFEGDTANLFALQDQVTALIGNSIGREMVVRAGRDSETRASDPQAADLILRADAAYLKPQSLENWVLIEGWMRQALALDPGNVTAMLGLGRALTVQAFNFGHKLAPDVKEKKYAEGHEWAMKVQELDPSNPRPYGAFALHAVAHDDFPAQRRATETWLSLDPKNPMAYNFMANVDVYLGNYQKSIDLLNQGTALDPKHPNVLLALTYIRAYFLMGDLDAAIEWAQTALGLNSRFSEPHAFLAMIYAIKGDDAKAKEEVAKLLRANPNFKLTKFRYPGSSKPDSYRAVHAEKIITAGRKAGLPE